MDEPEHDLRRWAKSGKWSSGLRGRDRVGGEMG
jgi:hypothetical protein